LEYTTAETVATPYAVDHLDRNMVPNDTNQESRITTDHTQVEAWASETNSIPVREGNHLRFITEESFDENRQQRVSWDEFESEIAETGRVVVYRENRDTDQLQIRHRDDAMTHLEGEDVEDRLISGEVITGTITETAVVERTIVEEAEIRSEVVDSQVVDSQIVDADLLARDCTACTSREAASDNYLDTYDDSYFLEDTEGDLLASHEDLTFDLEVDETWMLTIDELEQFDVESRVTDVDVAETDAVEDIDLEADLDMATLHRQILESNLFSIDIRQMEDFNTENYAIESEVEKNDTIRTTISRHRTVERELAMSHDITATGTESHRTNVSTVNENIVSSALAEPGQEPGSREMTGSETTSQTDATGDTDADRIIPNSDDQGKTVVDTAGTELGVVTEVDDNNIYVDPEPSLTEKVMSKLGWGDADEDDYVIESDAISRITDDQVVVKKPRK
jgi:hypothetical protein